MALVSTSDVSVLIGRVIEAYRKEEDLTSWFVSALATATCSPGPNLQTPVIVTILGEPIPTGPALVPTSMLPTGEYVTCDFHLALRQVLLVVAAVAYGKRSPTPLRSLAASLADQTAQFLCGGSTGSALVRNGYAYLSPSWLCLPTPRVVPGTVSIRHDPFTALLYSLPRGDDEWGDAVGKAIKVAYDPFFSLFAIRHDAILQLPQYTWVDVASYADAWAPAFLPGPGNDVLKRAGTYRSASTEMDWSNPVFERAYPEGRLLRILQLPLILDQPNIAVRFVREGDQWWFKGADVDYALGGAVSEDFVALMGHTDPASLKISYMQQRLTLRFPPGAVMSALQVSPLAFARSVGSFTLKGTNQGRVLSSTPALLLAFNSLSPSSIPAGVGDLIKMGRLNEGWLSQEAIDWVKTHL